MYSMLETIDRYIRDNNIPFNEIVIDYDKLDSYFDQAITDRLRKICGDYFHMGSLVYTLKYDDNDHLCLIATANKGRNVYVIYNKNETQIVNLPGKFYACSERAIVEDAAMLKYLEEQRLFIRKAILRTNPNISVTDRVKVEHSVMEDLKHDTFSKLSNEGMNISTLVDYDSIFSLNADRINEYIKYTNDAYQAHLERIKEKNAEEEKMHGISYTEPDVVSVPRVNHVPYSPSREKVNPIMSFASRNAILEGYPYIYREYAYVDDSDDITHMAYLYLVGYNKYMLVLEPYNGVKYTQMIIFERSYEVTKEEFIKLVKYYLELSYADSLKDDKIVRTNHTTLDTFRSNLDFAINGISSKLYNAYYKKRVRNLKEQ